MKIKWSRKQRDKNYIITFCFMFIIFGGFFVQSSSLVRSVGTTLLGVMRGEVSLSECVNTFKEGCNLTVYNQDLSLDIFSFVHRVLGKHEARNFEVIKSDEGQLYFHGTDGEIKTEELQIIADEYEILYEETFRYGGHFLYVQVPFKNIGQAPELADYSTDNTEESENYLVHLMQDKEIPVLDLRNYGKCAKYYKTDHHWTEESAFFASAYIAKEIKRIYGIDLTGHEYYGDIKNYEPITYRDCFLGSYGIRVGPYFAGRDDFTVYNPKFKTNFDFKHFIDGEKQFEHQGTFWETFIDQEMLEDSNYKNKYNVNMYCAYVESIIQNYLAQNDYSGLLITHSYGRSMAQYMSLNFKELRYLDPQVGRYNGNYVEYIRNYKPDVVILMYNDKINVGDGQWKEDE